MEPVGVLPETFVAAAYAVTGDELFVIVPVLNAAVVFSECFDVIAVDHKEKIRIGTFKPVDHRQAIVLEIPVGFR